MAVADYTTSWSMWASHSPNQTLTKMDVLLLIIRVGPVVGLIMTFVLGCLRRTCSLLTSVAFPLTSRPAYLLSKLLRCVMGCTDASRKLSAFLLYFYLPLFCFWWLIPQSARAKAGIITITAMPYFGTSIIRKLYCVSATMASIIAAIFKYIISAHVPVAKAAAADCQEPVYPETGGGLTQGDADELVTSRLLRRPSMAGVLVFVSFNRAVFLMVGRALGHLPLVLAKGSWPWPWPSSWSSPPVWVSVWTSPRAWVSAWTSPSAWASAWTSPQAWVSAWTSPSAWVSAWTSPRAWVSVWTSPRAWVSVWTSPRAWVSAWTPVLEASGPTGRDIYAGLDERHTEVLRQHNTRAALFTKLHWKGFSRAWGKLHNLAFPKWLLYIGLRVYVWVFGCKLHEAEVEDLRAYTNLAEFFRRRLRPGLRPIHRHHTLTSPADGRVLHLGPVHRGVLEQVKGVSYSMKGFLGPLGGVTCLPAGSSDVTSDELYAQALTTRPRHKLWQIIIYLAPGDYHHFHSPADWEVQRRRHFPGELFSVNPGVARWLQGLFNFNERAIYTGRWRYGFFSLTAVGATNVGSINVHFDKNLQTNTKSEYERGSYCDETFTDEHGRGRRVVKGEEIGEFNLGSTIVLLFEAPANFRFNVTPGGAVNYGQGIGHVCRGKHRKAKSRRHASRK